jgi:hypothetical protein
MMSRQPIDWSQLWYPGRREAFTPDEMARAGRDAASPTLVVVVAFNIATVAFVLMQLAPPGQTARLVAVLALLVSCGLVAARWLWWRPWRKPLLQVQLALLVLLVLLAAGIRWRLPERTDREAVALLLIVGLVTLLMLLWFLVMWRSAQIEGRLRELAEREKAIEMARRLASAQIEPHFLFNTLASLQHWVQTKDDRAAPLLAALTGYLRATLPLFNQPLLALGSELAAIEQYLRVMQLRMGARLAWELRVPEALHGARLPPGMLLTLVENAIVHGLEPHIAGGTVRLAAQAQAGVLTLEVSDNGRGPPPVLKEGVGLANLRQRLALAYGERASLRLQGAAAGGFEAKLQLPLELS